MEPVSSRFLRSGDAAVVEMAAASGLSLAPAAERDAMTATTFGTGQVLAAAVGLGCRRIVLGLGGSATTDGGAGLLPALGARFLDASEAPLTPGGGPLAGLATVDLDAISEVLADVTLVIASDVNNPLLGELGAAATYGPQKGADPDQVASLEAALGHYADVVEATIGRRLRDDRGSGAAGGTTFGLLAIADRFASLEVRPGVEVIMELTGFDEAIADCDVMLTGEGRVDEQTAYGKTAMGVARLGAIAVPVAEAPMSLEEHVAGGTDPIARAAERTARVVAIARRL